MELSHFCCLHRSDQLLEACLRVLHRFVTDFSRDLLGQCHHHQHQVGPGAHVGVKFPQLNVNNLELVTWRARKKTGGTRYWLNEKCPGRRSNLKNLENAPAKKKKKKQIKLLYPIYNIIPYKSREKPTDTWCFDWFHHFHFPISTKLLGLGPKELIAHCIAFLLPRGLKRRREKMGFGKWMKMACLDIWPNIPLAHLVIVTLEIAG